MGMGQNWFFHSSYEGWIPEFVVLGIVMTGIAWKKPVFSVIGQRIKFNNGYYGLSLFERVNSNQMKRICGICMPQVYNVLYARMTDGINSLKL